MKQTPTTPVSNSELANGVKDALEQSTQNLDAQTLGQLREARYNALAKKKSHMSLWAWPAMAAVTALIVILIFPPMMRSHQVESESVKLMIEMSGDDELASLDDIEMLEDLEMIQALGEDAGNG